MTRLKTLPAFCGFLPGAALLALALLLAAACGGEEAAPTATAVPGNTQAPAATVPPPPTEAPPTVAPEPTAAPRATDAPTPTAMPAPTPTEPPAPTPTPAAAEAPQPTEAPSATATQEPAATREPTATPEPTEEPTPAAPPTPFPPCEGNRGGAIGDCAPEFAGTQEWINSGPLTMEGLRGKVVLIDFWTYTCINCLRTLPFLREWHDRYAGEGLVIVGVHTPEFEFEKLYDNVAQATVDEGVAWPVVQDNEYAVWRSYSNRYWPAKYLIDQDGVIRYRHFGEGRYGETEEEIRKLLAGMGAHSEAFDQPLPGDQQRDATFTQAEDREQTPELFAGYNFAALQRRGGIGQVPTYAAAAQESYDTEGNPGVVAEFEIPSWYNRT